jgi:hypothetical protein
MVIPKPSRKQNYLDARRNIFLTENSTLIKQCSDAIDNGDYVFAERLIKKLNSKRKRNDWG